MLILAAILALFVYGMIAAMLGTILPALSTRFQLTPKQNGNIVFTYTHDNEKAPDQEHQGHSQPDVQIHLFSQKEGSLPHRSCDRLPCCVQPALCHPRLI